MATAINGGILVQDGVYFGAGTTVLKLGTFNVADMVNPQWGYYVPTSDGALNAASTVGGFYQSATAPSGGRQCIWFQYRPSSGVMQEFCISCESWAVYYTAVTDAAALASIPPYTPYTAIVTQPA